MSDEEREAIRQAGAEDALRSRIEHGFPERIEDPAALEDLVRLCVQLDKLRRSADRADDAHPENAASASPDGQAASKVLHSHGPPVLRG
jgi:hypothetical protein